MQLVEKREIFGFLFLAFIIGVLVFIFSQATPGFTGRIIGDPFLEETNYDPEEEIEGEISLKFSREDLIPKDAVVNILIGSSREDLDICSAIWDPVCGQDDNTYANVCYLQLADVLWKHNGECNPSSGPSGGAILDIKKGSFLHKFREFLFGTKEDSEEVVGTHLNTCTDESYKCCIPGLGIGNYLGNLTCDEGYECWSSCNNDNDPISLSLPKFIDISDHRTKGNYKYGNYKNVNGPSPIGQGFGFSACQSAVQRPDVPIITPAAVYTGNGEATTQETITRYPIHDAYIDSTSHQVHDNPNSLAVGSLGGVHFRSYFRFNLDNIQDITSANLKLYLRESYAFSTLYLYEIDDYDNNLNYDDHWDPIKELIGSKFSSGGNIQIININDPSKLTEDTINAFMLTTSSLHYFYSLESNPSLRPVLEITYTLPQTHTKCSSNNQCISVSGPGPNECSTYNDCAPQPTTCSQAGGVCSNGCNIGYYQSSLYCASGVCCVPLDKSCRNWDSSYTIDLEDLDLEAPEDPGEYEITVQLIHNFNGEPPLPEEPQANEPLLLFEEYIDFKVLGSSCTANFTCLDWNTCTNNTQNRFCYDLDNCQANYTQTQNCTISPSCTENWQCNTWSECISEIRTRTCNDINNCGTILNKPAETESCQIFEEEPRAGFPIWGWFILIIIVLLIIGLVTYYIVKNRRGFIEEEAEALAGGKHPARISPQLENYVKSALARGATKSQIRKTLLDAGWSKDVVEKVLFKY